VQPIPAIARFLGFEKVVYKYSSTNYVTLSLSGFLTQIKNKEKIKVDFLSYKIKCK